MCPFYQELKPSPCKRCKCFSSNLKNVFSICPAFCGCLSTASHEEEEADIEFDEEEEVFVSAVISAYVESKSKRLAGKSIKNISWVYSPGLEDTLNLEKGTLHLKENTEDEETESFFDVGSNFSCYSVPASIDAFVSAQASFSRSSSLNWLDLHHTAQKHPSVIENFRHCPGWPFGLCRKTLLFPPLPKSPADSWSWRKNGGKFRVH